MTIKWTRVALALLAVGVLAGATPAPAQVRRGGGRLQPRQHHLVRTARSRCAGTRSTSAARLVADRDDTADCFGVEVTFVPQPTMGSTQGTGVNHIGFSYADVTAKMAELEAVGVRGSGVRLQRFAGGATLREAPGGYLHGYIFDPVGHPHRAARRPGESRLPSRPPERDRAAGDPRLVRADVRR